jgi:hypothetical protein
MNFYGRNNRSLFTTGIDIFTTVYLSNFIQNLVKRIMNLDAYWCNDIWVIAERVVLFRKVMPMAMENLSIAQH